MLRDAARLQLTLTREALAESLITKDASAYNVQFVGSKPVFIDVGSFEKVRRGEPWAGYRQFCELFLNPLYVQAVRDVPFQPLLRGHLDGITPGVAAAIIGKAWALPQGHVHPRSAARPRRTQVRRRRPRARRPRRAQASRLRARADRRPAAQSRKAVDRLSWKQQDSTWSGYGDRGHYTDRDLDAKSSFVAAAVAAIGEPDNVLDLGANDGHFSRIALDAGARSVIGRRLRPPRRRPPLSPAPRAGRAAHPAPRRRPRRPVTGDRLAVAGTSRRSSNGCAPTSCCASPSSTTWR